MTPAHSTTLPSAIQQHLAALGSVWIVLWTLVSIIESSGYIHDPSIPRWEPEVLVSVLLCTIVGWLIVDIRSSGYTLALSDRPRAWFFHQLRRLPLIGSGYIVVVFGVRHALFAIAGVEYFHVGWPVLIPFEFIKASVFYCIWLGLVFGTLSLHRSRERAE